jgi:hypothetical protein
MIRLLPIIIIILISTTNLYAQSSIASRSFAYKKHKIKSKTFHQLTDASDTVTIAPDIQSKHTKDRSVVAYDQTFRFEYNKAKRQDEILNEDGVVLASTKGFYDVTTPNGNFYDCKKLSGKSWKYIYNGKDIVIGKFKKENGVRFIEITWESVDIQDRVLIQMMCQVYGADLIQARSTEPFIYVSTAIFAVAVAAATPDSTPNVN